MNFEQWPASVDQHWRRTPNATFPNGRLANGGLVKWRELNSFTRMSIINFARLAQSASCARMIRRMSASSCTPPLNGKPQSSGHFHSPTPTDHLFLFLPAMLFSGEQTYSCLWMKRRSPNIMEFKFSDKSSTVMNEKLCDDRNFISNNWITEGSKY